MGWRTLPAIDTSSREAATIAREDRKAPNKIAQTTQTMFRTVMATNGRRLPSHIFAMKVRLKFLLGLLLLAGTSNVSAADVELSEEIMKMTKLAGELSELTFDDGLLSSSSSSSASWRNLQVFDDVVDRALVAARGGRCYAAFRGTTWSWRDWQQNFDVSNRRVCIGADGGSTGSGGSSKECCTVHQGFWGGYYEPSYRQDFEGALRDCAKSTCTNADDCVVLTGHSQGGGIAAIAALYLTDLDRK